MNTEIKVIKCRISGFRGVASDRTLEREKEHVALFNLGKALDDGYTLLGMAASQDCIFYTLSKRRNEEPELPAPMLGYRG